MTGVKTAGEAGLVDKDETPVRYERTGRVVHIVLNRPQVLNAFSDESILTLRDCLRRFDRDDDAWVAILRGEGRAFSSGADVRRRQLRSAEEMKAQGGPSGNVNHANLLFEGFVNWKPVIAAVHGYVCGMALGLALKCDLVVADAETQFEVTEAKRGLYAGPFWAVMQFRGAGTLADDVALTGRRFTGQEAFDGGLVNQVTSGDGHVAAAEALAETLLSRPPLAARSVVRARRWLLQQNETQHTLLSDAWKLHLSEDFRESAHAFAEGRTPGPFVGR